MKTLFHSTLIAITMALLATACSKKPEKPRPMESVVSKADLPLPQSVADSIVGNYGYLIAYDYLRHLEADTTGATANFDKEAFLRGVDIVIADSASSNAYTQGVQSALSILGQINDLRAKGVKVNIPLIIKGIKETLYTDSVTPEQIAEAAGRCNDFMTPVYTNH